jgi:hypothetical protein
MLQAVIVVGWVERAHSPHDRAGATVVGSAQTDQVRRAAGRLADGCLALSLIAGMYAMVALLAALTEANALPDARPAASATLGCWCCGH